MCAFPLPPATTCGLYTLRGDEMSASRPLRTPRAAGIAGVLFAVLLAMALVLLRVAEDSQRPRAMPTDWRIALALNLVPFAGLAFLWLIGVVRDRIGQREDRFLATVFLGSGLLFVAMLFVASAVATGTFAAAAAAPAGGPTEAWTLGRKIAATLMNTYAMRMAAVFMVSTSTIGLRTGFIPRWIGFSGYAIAAVLLLGLKVTLWVQLLFPLWVLILSFDIVVETFRERPAPAPAGTPWDLPGETGARKSA